MITIPISPGELYDRISILVLKRDLLTDPDKHAHVAAELAMLEAVRNGIVVPDDVDLVLADEVRFLARTNERIYRAIEQQSALHAAGKFDDEYVMVSRYVLEQNAIRSLIKRQINNLLDSTLQEVKSTDLGV